MMLEKKWRFDVNEGYCWQIKIANYAVRWQLRVPDEGIRWHLFDSIRRFFVMQCFKKHPDHWVDLPTPKPNGER